MIYVLDTSSLSELKSFYAGPFEHVWEKMDSLVREGRLVSTREVKKELDRWSRSKTLDDWVKRNASIFTIPTDIEMGFLGELFAAKGGHFQALISKKNRLAGWPVADPFVIAAAYARMRNATVVTEERPKPNSARIPEACKHFSIGCTNLEGLMKAEGWRFVAA